MYNSTLLSTYDLNEGVEPLTVPLSTLGVGRGTALRKTINVSSLYVHECEGEDNFEETRYSVPGGTTDQGAGRTIGDNTVRVVPGYEGRSLPSGPLIFVMAVGLVGHRPSSCLI